MRRVQLNDRRAFLIASMGAGTTALLPSMGRADSAPVAQTHAGRVRGSIRDGVNVFLGVPYGADTGGKNRWMPPKPAAAWSGVREATTYGPAPPQVNPMDAPMHEETDLLQKGPFGEDCLRLNIYTPAVGRSSGSRAVMVWFHGGGFSAGSGNAASYDGVNLARKQDVVLVSVTHRLNHFGFLYLGDAFGADYADSGNVGMLDCVAALNWVRQNIGQFGGDPGRVLVFGQSGGGSKVSTLMGMPAAKGLFHRAAAQSGVAVRSGTRARAAASARQLLDALNVKSIGELQSLPWQKIIEVGGPGFDAGPIVDGRNLPADVFDPSASPLSKNVPLITSTVETESAAWGAPIDPISDAELLSRVKQVTRLADSDAQALIGVYRTTYPGKDDTYVCQLLMSQWTFTDAVTTEAERKAVQAQQGGAPEYFFYFAHHTKVRGGKLHAPHTSEIPYCFDSLAASSSIIGELTQEEQFLADTVSAYWANFAKTGDPNGQGLPLWRPYDLKSRATLVVSTEDKVACVDDPMLATREAIAHYKANVSRA
jgi:para-nitrobenzyl esterase